jgi:hypothetical protein
MRRVAVLGIVLVAAGLVEPAAHAQDGHLISIGANPLVPGPDRMPASELSIPITLDLSLPSEVEWLAQRNADATASAPAGTPGQDCTDAIRTPICNCVQPWEVFHKRQTEVAFMTGSLFFPIGIGPSGPTTVFVPQLARFGFMVNDSDPSRRFMKGSLEAIFEVTTLPFVSGPGNILVGGALYGRYNFSTRFPRLVPYFQMGGGGSYSDSYRFPRSDLSTGFEFILHMGIGTHYLLNSRWALTAEYDYFHFSNAGMKIHNFGINAIGGTIGITRFLR